MYFLTFFPPLNLSEDGLSIKYYFLEKMGLIKISNIFKNGEIDELELSASRAQRTLPRPRGRRPSPTLRAGK